MWLEGQEVSVQERILVPEALIEPLDPKHPYRQIGERRVVNEDGLAISEWQLTLADIQDFVERRAAQYSSRPSRAAQ